MICQVECVSKSKWYEEMFSPGNGDWNFSGGYMNKTNDCLMIDSYVCGLNSELFLHTDKNHSFFAVRDQLINAEKHLHSDFVSVRVCSQFIFTKI